jgi:hypothetical protein
MLTVMFDEAVVEMRRNAMVAFAAANREAFNIWVREVGAESYRAHFVELKGQMEKLAAQMKDPNLFSLGLVGEAIERLPTELQLPEEDARTILKRYAKHGS